MIWPDTWQLALFASTPWYLTLNGDAEFRDKTGHSLPLERMSWLLQPGDGSAPIWTPVTSTAVQVVSSPLPTEVSGTNIAIGLRLDPSWSDPPGGPFQTGLRLTLNGGTDLVPSYVWPQPALAGQNVTITYYTGEATGSPTVFVTLDINTMDGTVVTSEHTTAVAENWQTITWSGRKADGTAVQPGTYKYEITGPDGQQLAQGHIVVAAEANEEGTGSVSGSVTANETPVSEATVHLFDSAYRLVSSISTNQDGLFSFVELGLGAYHVEVHYPGYFTWQSERFTLSETNTHHTVSAKLTPNNAMFVNAQVHVVNSLTNKPGGKSQAGVVHPGDIVALQGVLRNTGTRLLRASTVKVSWPSGLVPLMLEPGMDGVISSRVGREALGAVRKTTESATTIRVPDLQPGKSFAFEVVAVVGLCVWPNRIVLQGEAWAEQGDGSLQRVNSPPQFVQLNVVPTENSASGLLAMQLYLDTNGNNLPDDDEPGAGGVCLELSSGEKLVTSADGWVHVPVSDGVVTVWMQDKSAPNGRQMVHSSIVQPGELDVVRVGLQRENGLLVIHTNQAVVVWSPQADRKWQGAGELNVDNDTWNISWQPPYRWQLKLRPRIDANSSLQAFSLLVKHNVEKPAILLSASGKGAMSSTARPAELSVAVAAGMEPAIRQIQLPADGSGPYQLPGPVQAVHRIAVCSPERTVILPADQYSWSPTGMVWLAQAPELVLATYKDSATEAVNTNLKTDCAKVQSNVVSGVALEVVYSPGIPFYPVREHVWAAAVTARPQRSTSEQGGTDLNEEFQLRLKGSPNEQAAWRFLWERKSVRSQFTLESGTMADLGADPPGALLEPDLSKDASHNPCNDSCFRGMQPTFIRVTQLVKQDKWQLSTSYEQAATEIRRTLTFDWKLVALLSGEVGLSLTQLSDSQNSSSTTVGLTSSSTQLDATLHLKHEYVNWQWEVKQRVPLLISGEGSFNEGTTKSPYRLNTGRLLTPPKPVGTLRLAWRNMKKPGIGLALHIDTIDERSNIKVSAEKRINPLVEASTGVNLQLSNPASPQPSVLGAVTYRSTVPLLQIWHATAVSWSPWLKLRWQLPTSNSESGLQVALTGDEGDNVGVEAVANAGSIHTKWELHAKRSTIELGLRLTPSPHHYCSIQVRTISLHTDNALQLTSEAMWTGPVLSTWPDIAASLFSATHAYKGGALPITALNGVIGASIRYETEKNTMATGISLPWVYAESTTQKRIFYEAEPSNWLLWERRLAKCMGAYLWGGLELRTEKGRWTPRLQFVLR